VDELVHEHGASHCRDDFHGILANTILMLGAYSTERDCLIAGFEIGTKFGGSEGVVVGAKALNLETIFGVFLIKFALTG